MITPALELLRNKRPWLIAVLILLLLDVVSFSVIAFYQSPELERRKAAWTEQRKRLDAVDRGEAASDYARAKGDLERLSAMIPLRRDFPQLLGEITRSSSLCGVAADSIVYKPTYLKERKLVSYNITMSVSGRYASLRCFLHQVRTMRELVVIDALSLSNQDPYEEKVTMELKMTAYLRDGA